MIIILTFEGLGSNFKNTTQSKKSLSWVGFYKFLWNWKLKDILEPYEKCFLVLY